MIRNTKQNNTTSPDSVGSHRANIMHWIAVALVWERDYSCTFRNK